MDYPKSVPGVGLMNGKFVDENTVSGAPGSLISASWGNAVTDELLAVIQAAQIEPSEGDLDQLLEAIRYIVQDDAYAKERVYNKEEIDALLKNNNVVPIGMMVPFPVAAVPAGFLEVDGSLQNSATYPDLAAYLGTRFNLPGEPAGYFRLPESRGEFLRGWDHGRGIDADRTVGSSQLDAFQNITGVIGLRGGTAAGTGVLDGATGAFSTSFGWGGVANTVSRDGSTSNRGDTVFFDASTVARTSTETRPRNLAVMWCIKAWSVPVNQGSIDVAALAATVAHATSGKQGFARFGTMAEQVGGLLDNVISHPLGVVTLLNSWFSKRTFAANDYIRIPDVDGGLIIQWGYVLKPSTAAVAVTWPVAFPRGFCRCIASFGGAANPANGVSTGTPNNTGATFYSSVGGAGYDISYIAIGW
ncbi:tail fiber protein [Pseudomonas cichorii]|nr:phage tail protein [Pseudomonas cichorii]MBX8566769.1 tail fiber protein [Pseudomonas cichorii]